MTSDESLEVPQDAQSALAPQTPRGDAENPGAKPTSATRISGRFLSLVEAIRESEKFRFLIIGGINTLFGYSVFTLLEVVAGDHIGYLISLFVSYVFGTILAFVLHRRYTFRATGPGNVVADFFRFASIYVVSLVINVVALPLLVEVVGLEPVAGQSLVVVVTTLISYFGHKYFSFRRSNMKNSEAKVGINPDESIKP